MLHQGLPVHGYQPQSEDKINTVNHFKMVEEMLLRQAESVRVAAQTDDARRAANVAITYLQTGFMWLNRAVFDPRRISLPEDEMVVGFEVPPDSAA